LFSGARGSRRPCADAKPCPGERRRRRIIIRHYEDLMGAQGGWAQTWADRLDPITRHKRGAWHDATSTELRAQQYGASTELRHEVTFGRTCLDSCGTSAELRHAATSTELRAQWPHLYVFSPRRCVNGLWHQWGTVHGDDGVGHPIAERGPLVCPGTMFDWCFSLV
jgi:hypothetical protein